MNGTSDRPVSREQEIAEEVETLARQLIDVAVNNPRAYAEATVAKTISTLSLVARRDVRDTAYLALRTLREMADAAERAEKGRRR